MRLSRPSVCEALPRMTPALSQYRKRTSCTSVCRSLLKTSAWAMACESSITLLDGLAAPSGLEYRGSTIHAIAATTRFEEVAYLVLEGRLPNKAELPAFEQELKAARSLPPEVIETIEMLPKGIH